MTDATTDAIAAGERIKQAMADAEQARKDRDAAVVRMYKSGMRAGQIARTLGGISESGVRYILRGSGIKA